MSIADVLGRLVRHSLTISRSFVTWQRISLSSNRHERASNCARIWSGLPDFGEASDFCRMAMELLASGKACIRRFDLNRI
jgi:hypothetical protein